MDRRLEAQARSHDANRQAQIARGAYRHLVPGEHRTRSIGGQLQIVAIGQQAMLQAICSAYSSTSCTPPRRWSPLPAGCDRP
jgi:hypothetical protein